MPKLIDVQVPEDWIPIGERSAACRAIKTRGRVYAPIEGPSLTKESFGADADINAIMKRYQSTGAIPEARPGEPQYGDFSQGIDYHEALNRVAAVETLFDGLPVEVKIFCDQDPGRLIDLVYSEDPAVRAKAEELGLVKRRKPASQDPSGSKIDPGGVSGVPPKIEP